MCRKSVGIRGKAFRGESAHAHIAKLPKVKPPLTAALRQICSIAIAISSFIDDVGCLLPKITKGSFVLLCLSNCFFQHCSSCAKGGRGLEDSHLPEVRIRRLTSESHRQYH